MALANAAFVAHLPILFDINAAWAAINVGLAVGNIYLAVSIRRERRDGTAIPLAYGTDRQRMNLVDLRYFDGDRSGLVADPEASARARELLLRLLTPEQREDYRGSRRFLVRTDTADYLLRWGTRVVAYRNGAARTICIIFADTGTLPEEDRLIATLLMIRTEESEFWERFGAQPQALGMLAELSALAQNHDITRSSTDAF
jgi:hypothetical protein